MEKLNEGVVHFLDNAPTKKLIQVIDKGAITIQELKEYKKIKEQEEERKKKIKKKLKFKLFLKSI